jgi:hypothetical protein
MKLNIILETDMKKYWLSTTQYYSMESYEKFIKYFIPKEICVTDQTKYNAVLHGVQLSPSEVLEKDKIHMMMCVENCSFHKIYKHYIPYGDYGNKEIAVYLYNHINKVEETDTYIAIPIIYCQMTYFKVNYPLIEPTQKVAFKNKKFCICLTTNDYRDFEKKTSMNFLSKFGECDTIDIHRAQLKNASCYHSDEFLNLIQQYKFAFVCENSLNDGYITEKIFNCFFARSIPIYNGSRKIESYFNKDTFINFNDMDNLSQHIPLIIKLRTDETLYNKTISSPKINNYDDENYGERLSNFISNYPLQSLARGNPDIYLSNLK